MENRLQDHLQGQEKEKKKKGKAPLWKNWIVRGLVASLLASCLYLFCVEAFCVDHAGHGMDVGNPLAQQDTIDWLVRQSYVFYHDLAQKQSAEPVSFQELYVVPREGCGWVLEQDLHNTYEAANKTPLREMGEEALCADYGSVYSYLKYLQNGYFAHLEEQYDQINAVFDYCCEDLGTGESVTNFLGAGSIMENLDGYFCLILHFDENGNCRLERAERDAEVTEARKLASAAIRNGRLEADSTYSHYDEETEAGLDAYFTLCGPRNCRIVYYISHEDWIRLAEEGFQLNDIFYGPKVEAFVRYRGSGVSVMHLLIWLAVAGLAAVLGHVAVDGEGRPVSRWLRLPLEAVLACGYVECGLGRHMSFMLLETEGIVELLAHSGLFFLAWYLGMNLWELRALGGLRGFIRKRSLVYRFFPYAKSRVAAFYEELRHFDVTRNASKTIFKLVLVNGVILFIISSLWFGGLGVAVVYSVLLYFILRKYVSDLQKKYGLLLKATNEIAEGNLDVQIQEDLGVFEPFKPQIQRIQSGFRRAVEEEVKSQRMKTELITNVSHDLKTPLTAIITYINLLKEPNITEGQRGEYLDTLERKSLRLKALIEDLFEVSKANSQSMALNLMDVDIMGLVKQVAFEMGDKLAERNLDLRLALPEEKAPIRLDSQRTYRIYENLFANIAKYAMPATRVYVNGFYTEDKAVVTLKNITEDEISVSAQELTERFVRGDASRNTEGSGLGLAIAQSFTKLQGGTLELEVDGDLFKVVTVWRRDPGDGSAERVV